MGGRVQSGAAVSRECLLFFTKGCGDENHARVYLSGELTVKPSPDYKPEDFRGVWTGTLKLPKLKLSLPALREARKDRQTGQSDL